MPRPRDVTLPLDAGTPRFPGDPPIDIRRVRSLERGDPYCLSALLMGSHSGTHLDAPAHFLPAGTTVDHVDLAALNGPAYVVVDDRPEGPIDPATLRRAPEGTARLLVRTRNSTGWARGEGFGPNFAAITPAGAETALRLGVRLLGVDGLSVENDPARQFPVHHRLLSAGCWILEGLALDGVPEGPHELRCLPLRLTGADGAPCRAALWS